jgi:hypothetical protein
VEPRNTSTRSSRATSQPSAPHRADFGNSCFMPNTSFHVKGFVNHSGHKASQQVYRHKFGEESMTGRILIVDDVATNRIVMKVKLAHACYSVEQADSGAAPLRRRGKTAPISSSSTC